MSDTLVICNHTGQPGCDGNCGHARQHLRNRACGPSACPDVNSYIVECRHIGSAPRATQLTPADIERLRSFEADHAPDGWPAIQMRDISALLDEVERLRGDAVECHQGRDVLASLYDAMQQLPCCGTQAILAAAAQEIQALRGQEQ